MGLHVRLQSLHHLNDIYYSVLFALQTLVNQVVCSIIERILVTFILTSDDFRIWVSGFYVSKNKNDSANGTILTVISSPLHCFYWKIYLGALAIVNFRSCNSFSLIFLVISTAAIIWTAFYVLLSFALARIFELLRCERSRSAGG